MSFFFNLSALCRGLVLVFLQNISKRREICPWDVRCHRLSKVGTWQRRQRSLCGSCLLAIRTNPFIHCFSILRCPWFRPKLIAWFVTISKQLVVFPKPHLPPNMIRDLGAKTSYRSSGPETQHNFVFHLLPTTEDWRRWAVVKNGERQRGPEVEYIPFGRWIRDGLLCNVICSDWI